jgi:uncharacterized coiled-coil protein SlyX
MSSTLRRTRSDVSTSLWGTEPLIDETPLRAANDEFPSKRPSLGKRGSRTLARFLITFCIGVAATLVWQSYGDAAREMIAKASPQFSWLAPQPAAVQTPNMVASGAPSPDQQQFKAISFGIAAMRQSVDQLQNQITNEITKLRAAQQEILDKISMPPPPRPAAAPARKPVLPTPMSQASPVR